MGFTEIFIIAFGLAMDAFAMAVCKGVSNVGVSNRQAATVACSFGFFQALMPLIGFMLGMQFEWLIKPIDHWIAFVLLAGIGINMIIESRKKDDVNCHTLDFKSTIVASVATSIDALIVGITFAFLSAGDIMPAITVIGITAFVLSFIGIKLGSAFGMKYKKTAELAGGIILILMGVKILLEHLGVLL